MSAFEKDVPLKPHVEERKVFYASLPACLLYPQREPLLNFGVISEFCLQERLKK